MTGFKSPLARKSAVALTVIGSALGGVLSSAKTTGAQTVHTTASANVQATQVTVTDFAALFSDVLIQNTQYWLTHNQQGDAVDAILLNEVRSAPDQKTLALITNATAMGLKNQIIAATPEASGSATLERDGWDLNQTSLVNATIKYGAATVSYEGDNVIFDLAVLANTNAQLRGMAKHNMGYVQYMTEVFMPFAKTNPSASLSDKDVSKTFQRLRLANTTVPANNPQR